MSSLKCLLGFHTYKTLDGIVHGGSEKCERCGKQKPAIGGIYLPPVGSHSTDPFTKKDADDRPEPPEPDTTIFM